MMVYFDTNDTRQNTSNSDNCVHLFKAILISYGIVNIHLDQRFLAFLTAAHTEFYIGKISWHTTK